MTAAADVHGTPKTGAPAAPWWRSLGLVLAAGALLIYAAILVLGHRAGWEAGGEPLGQELPWQTVNAAAVIVGALLVWRRPRNPAGWALSVMALGFLVTPAVKLLVDLHPEPPAWVVAAAWTANWSWVLANGGGLFLFLLFPDGSLPSPRWRWVGWGVGAGIGVLLLVTALAPQLVELPGRPNPIGVAAIEPLIEPLFPVLVVLSVVSLASALVRFRRSRGVERQQLKWVAVGAVAVGVSMFGMSFGLPRWTNAIGPGVLVAAIAVAVLRYKLYEIDRIISRTLSYTLVTGVLVGVYVGAVLLLGRVLAPLAAESEVAVAASTLLVAALFQPVRRRVQTVVDRRFNRARYDAQRTVEDFAAHLRDAVDLDDLHGELGRVVTATMQPASLSVWLRGIAR
jgi:hypothetical protein